MFRSLVSNATLALELDHRVVAHLPNYRRLGCSNSVLPFSDFVRREASRWILTFRVSFTACQ